MLASPKREALQEISASSQGRSMAAKAIDSTGNLDCNSVIPFGEGAEEAGFPLVLGVISEKV
jgi:hypothetical protein